MSQSDFKDVTHFFVAFAWPKLCRNPFEQRLPHRDETDHVALLLVCCQSCGRPKFAAP